jgi:23S rRNA G2445 N2-methylase RlmL
LNVRLIPRTPAFSVTASFVGGRNYTMTEIKAAVAEGIAQRYPQWQYREDDAESALNVRIFIDHDRALVGLRVGERPLYRRAYKHDHLPGSLKPTVAAAMVRLAAVRPGSRLIDAFCGSGTVLAEAHLMGAAAWGGDISTEAVHSTEVNLTSVGRSRDSSGVVQWDARRLPLAAQTFDCAVSNLPWGRQIVVNDDLRTLYAAAFTEMRRVVKPGSPIVVLTSVPELLPGTPNRMLEISLFGQTPVIALLPG